MIVDELSSHTHTHCHVGVFGRMAMNGLRGPGWRNDSSVLDRHTLGNLVDSIDAHLHAAPSLGDMVELAGISPGHFAIKFRRSSGFPACPLLLRSFASLPSRG